MNKNVHEILNNVFYKDGSLRDIYIFNTEIITWEKVIKFIKNKWNYKFIIDGDIIDELVHYSVQDIFNRRSTHSIIMIISIGEIDVACHFFDVNEIEFDIWPNDINDENGINKLLYFMKGLATLTSKNVILTPENMSTTELLKVDKNGQIFWK